MKNYGYVLILISDSEFFRKFQDGIMKGIGLLEPDIFFTFA